MSPPPILLYHWFRRAQERSKSRSPQLEITPERFAEQIAWLASRGWSTASLERGFPQGAAPSHSKRSVVITFDDGTRDFAEHARPVLLQHGFFATLFVVSGHVGGVSSWDQNLGELARPLLGWDDLRALSAEGFEIGSHTHRHRPLTTLTDDEAREELALSRTTLSEQLGGAPEQFAYPRGFYRAEHRRLVREAGYSGACAVLLGWRDLWRSGPWSRMRMPIKGTEPPSFFRWRLRLAALVPSGSA